MSSPGAVQVTFNTYLSHGVPGTDRVLFDGSDPDATAKHGSVVKVLLPAGAVDQQFDLAAYESVTHWGIQDVTVDGAGIYWGLSSGGVGQFVLPAGKGFVIPLGNNPSPIIYLSNPDADNPAYLEFVIVGNTAS